ncbi:hypothetical protein GCM10028824_08370 [Hymenobacter segetis]|uniref:Tetratricopeptide repeat protein n=1 Tax=Hymenobacter segetis TaxID=2025509 RepID=A0ABU9LSC6_9BACT
MTRATLLHVLDRPTALGPAEVRELEQLAQAFPYCQTAHLLLAKAAHDQGTMLAGQRLRRAATYAADRSLLRRLIEQVEPLPVAIPVSEAEPAIEVPVLAVIEPASAAEAAPLLTPEPVAPATEIPAPPLAAVVIEAIPEPVAAVAEPQPVAITPIVPPTSVEIEQVLPPAVAAQLPTEQAAASAPIIEALPEAVPTAEPIAPAPTVTEVSVVLPEVAPVAVEVLVALLPSHELPPITAEPQAVELVAEPAPVDSLILVDQEQAAITPDSLPETLEITPAPAAEAPQATLVADELPAQAPAIRPPVEVGEARFEFGLADAAPAIVPTYELPGLIDEWAASAVTRSLGSSGAFALPSPAPAAPVFTPAAFTGDAVVGYSFGESSRLGLSMQLLDLLIAKAEAAETATAVVAAAQPPAVPLPPTGTFFEPDPLLLDHWATHCPAPPELPSTVDLINNFLKRQPRLTRPGMLPPSPGGQPDLSVRSTRAEPDLVSENLARIFVRQGKTARAIEIYEKLMVKQPEKMAYFALQIQSLQPSA